MTTTRFAYYILVIAIICACGLNKQGIIDRFDERSAQIQRSLAPDPSLQVFSADLENENGRWILNGETTLSDARSEIILLADSLLGQEAYTNNFILLPDETLGDSTFGIINISVAHLRRNPRVSGELLDQTILGRSVRLLKRQKAWYLVQTDYGYIGWMKRYSFKRTDQTGIKEWEMSERVRITEIYSQMFTNADLTSLPASDLVLNAEMKLIKRGAVWSKVQLPDGLEGYVQTNHVERIQERMQKPEDRVSDIIEMAKRMMGVPYMWGGNSSKANDCSGFTQTVFKACGIQLPRDARQQVLMGTEIQPDDTFSNVLAGDLFFFGIEDRITHVGIGLGGPEFIHQGSKVHINSLNSEDEHFNAFRKRTFKKIKRIF
jgi:cell wall-associated NlpC family hydrolase